MKIVFLDAKTIGDDIDLSGFDSLGEVTKYNFTTPEEAPERVKDADVLIINKVPINENTVGTAKNLKLVCVTATGTNNLDKDYLDSHKIAWRNVAGYSTETVTQHTFAMLFYLLEKLRYYDDYVKDGNYINDTSFTHFAEHFSEINGKTWGIIGLGAIGLWTARMAKGFGMKVIANSRHKKTGPQYDGIEQVSMEEIFERSDAISIHCPHTKETENLLNREAFAKMKDGVIIINTARGIIIDEEALLEALESRKVYMAGLDVVANEPPQYQIPLMQSPYTFITSHIAWQPKAARLRAVDLAVKNFRSYLEGMPTSVIN